MIDANVGQASLGIWDFCWSISNYIAMANLGVGSSINRFVAKYRAANEIENLRIAVSSVCFVQSIIASVVFIVICIVLACIEPVFGDKLGNQTYAARWIIGAIGLSMVIELITDGARGVITGCHRWDLLNGIQATTRAISVGLMLTSLLLGGGIIHLGIIHLILSATAAILRVYLAFRICPELVIGRKYVKLAQARVMLGFGINTVALGLPPLILVQTVSILVLANLGPAMVAVLARPIALVHHIESFVNKFSFLMTPMAGAMQGANKEEEVTQLVLMSTRYSAAFAFPLVSFLMVFGDEVLRIWMGASYVNWFLIATIASGNFLIITQGPIVRILIGVDLHGRIGFANMLIVFILFLLGVLYLEQFGWTLDRVGLVLTIPLIIGSGVFVPVYACKKLQIKFSEYILSIVRPTVCGFGFTGLLVITRVAYQEYGVPALIIGMTLSALTLAISYWFIVLTAAHKQRFIRSLI